MKIVEASAQIMDELDGDSILRKIENAARTCYQSQGIAGQGTACKLVSSCIKRGHDSVLEHVSISVRFVVDRAVHSELVRHRIASFSAESTRYCNYSSGKFDGEITVIKPCYWQEDSAEYKAWKGACEMLENSYLSLIAFGAKPEEARAILPLSLKTEMVMTANLREWRHILKLRCASNAHPSMRGVMIPLLEELQFQIPIVFDDIGGIHREPCPDMQCSDCPAI